LPAAVSTVTRQGSTGVWAISKAQKQQGPHFTSCEVTFFSVRNHSRVC